MDVIITFCKFVEAARLAFAHIDLLKLFSTNVLNLIALLGIPFFAYSATGHARVIWTIASIVLVGVFFPWSVMQGAIAEYQSQENTKVLLQELKADLEARGIDKQYVQFGDNNDYLITDIALFKAAVENKSWYEVYGQSLLSSIVIKPLIVNSSKSLTENVTTNNTELVNNFTRQADDQSVQIQTQFAHLDTLLQGHIDDVAEGVGANGLEFSNISSQVSEAQGNIVTLNTSVENVSQKLAALETSFSQSQLKQFVNRFDETTQILQASESRYNALSAYVTCLREMSLWDKITDDKQCDEEKRKLEEASGLRSPLIQTAHVNSTD